MQRRPAERTQPLVPLAPVVVQAVDQLGALGFVDHAGGEERAGRLDTGEHRLDVSRPGDHLDRLDAQLLGFLLPADAGAQLADVGIVRHVVLAVGVSTLVQLPCVERQTLAGGLQVIDQPVLHSNPLPENDGHGVVHAQVPEGVHRVTVVIGHRGDPAFLANALHGLGVVGAFDRGLERLLGRPGKLALHVVTLLPGLFRVPGTGVRADLLADLGLDPVQVVVDLSRHGHGVRRQLVLRPHPPAEEMELEVEHGHWCAGIAQGLRLLAHVVERALPALGGGFDDDDVSGPDRVEGAGPDLPCHLRLAGGDLAVLGNVEDLQGAATVRGADIHPAAVGPLQGLLGVGDQRDGGLDRFRQAVVGEPDLVELLLRVGEGDVDDTGLGVRRPQTGVEDEHGDQRREPALPVLEDDVQPPHCFPKARLALVHPERHNLAGLVGDPVQIVHAPVAIGEQLLQLGRGGHAVSPPPPGNVRLELACISAMTAATASAGLLCLLSRSKIPRCRPMSTRAARLSASLNRILSPSMVISWIAAA